jgi:hypothetical protein
VTWLDFVAQLVWAAVVLYAVTELSHVLSDAFLGFRSIRAAQLQDTATHPADTMPTTGTPLHREDQKGQTSQLHSTAIVIPDDLEALALRESEAWARDDVRAVIKEKFRELDSGEAAVTWQRVRRAMGIGEMP